MDTFTLNGIYYLCLIILTHVEKSIILYPEMYHQVPGISCFGAFEVFELGDTSTMSHVLWELWVIFWNLVFDQILYLRMADESANWAKKVKHECR